MYRNKTIGAVIPALNEERFIAAVINGIPKYIDRIYVIDDASTDATNEIASQLAAGNPERIRVIKHEQNGGVGKSVVTGYKACLEEKMDMAVVLAGDNQMNPLEMTKLLDPIIDGAADYTAGDRFSKPGHTKGMSPWRQFGNRILRWLTRIAAWNFSISDPQQGYAAATLEVLTKLDLDSIYPRYGYLNDMLVKLTVNRARIKYIPMAGIYGDEKSKIRYWHYIPTVSWLLLKDFLWRLKIQLFSRGQTKKTNTPDSANRGKS
jgi:glycosyltransferase involved in cell wall biosynthesis